MPLSGEFGIRLFHVEHHGKPKHATKTHPALVYGRVIARAGYVPLVIAGCRRRLKGGPFFMNFRLVVLRGYPDFLKIQIARL